MDILGADPLSRFLNEARGREWSWGTWDCGQWLGCYLASIRGVNPAEQWDYRNEFGAKRLIREAGGMVEHIARSVEPFGFVRTHTPVRGDIAVVDAPEGDTGAIVMTGTVARIMQPRGLVLMSLPIKAAWRI